MQKYMCVWFEKVKLGQSWKKLDMKIFPYQSCNISRFIFFCFVLVHTKFESSSYPSFRAAEIVNKFSIMLAQDCRELLNFQHPTSDGNVSSNAMREAIQGI